VVNCRAAVYRRLEEARKAVFVTANLPIGSELLGYRIEALLGRGGTSVVYRAEHLRLKRKVALKLLAPELAEDARFRERFLRESELAASLDHPHIVPIYDAGEAEGQLYIAMRFFAGGDLRKLLREEGRLEPARALVLLAQVAEALDAAHEAGLVHRDVKPANVMLDEHGRCYLSDFGLTKQVSSQSGFTATGQIAGTIDYLAPEVIEGKALTPRADLYSLGCMLFECLAEVPPFRRESEFAVLWAHVNEPPPKLSERGEELPEELDAVVAKTLAKAPERRYASAGELIQAAREALPEAAGPPPRRRRGRLLAGAGALAAAALATVLPLVLVGGSGTPGAKPTLAITTSSIQRIDPETNKLVATIAVPVENSLLAAGGGSVWAANGDKNRLFRIDPKRNAVVQTVETFDPRALAYGAGGFLWVLDGSDGIVWKFDPASGASTSAIPLPPGKQFGPPDIVRATDEAVWVQWAATDGNAVRIDPSSTAAKAVTIGSKTVPVIIDFAPVGPVLWSAIPDTKHHATSGVMRTDLRRPDAPPTFVTTATEFPSIAADAGGLWLVDSGRERVLHIDARTNRIDRRLPVGRSPVWIAEGEGAVWVANSGSNTVSRIDPTSGKVVATIPVGASPESVVVGEGGVWVDVYP
jgi:YVTN family beta-propeller protein